MNMKQKRVFQVGFKGKKIIVKNYRTCDNLFSKARGLMFRSKNFNESLLFVFSKPGIYPIHSFFCRKFIAVWMLNGKITDEKLVLPWKFSVTPKGKFDELLEIPLSAVGKRNI